jgi:acyl carrier protein
MSWLSRFAERERQQKQQKLEQVLTGRESLDASQLWARYFRQDDIAPDTVAKIRQIFSEILGVDLSRIRDTDDFSKELAFFWDFDSMADVELIQALEQQFGITITDAEAEAMKTLKDIVLTVHAKIAKQIRLTRPLQRTADGAFCLRL